jgi:2-aminoethylphosphonate dioxygenase
MLTDDATSKNFRHSGWVLLRDLLTREQREALQSWADGAGNHESDAWLRYHEISPGGTRVLSRIENFIEPSCPIAFLVQASSPLISVISALFQDEPVLFKDKINMKPSGGGAYTLHQDAPAYRGFGIADFITAMIAVDDATVANGCLEFALGPRIRRELELDDDGQIIAAEIADIRFEPVPVRSGDAIVFDGLVPHRSASNHSDASRRALFLTFNPRNQGDKRTEYYQAKRQLFPPQDQREADRDYRKTGRQFNLGNPFV